MGVFNLDEQFTFYAQYHDNKANQAIHVACVWPILWTALIFGCYTGPFQETPDYLANLPYGHLIVMNLSFYAAIIYMLFYVMLDKTLGFVSAGLVLGGFFAANYLVDYVPEVYGVPAWKVALPVHIFCWVAQFFGHGVFEGRAPALLDNLVQAIMMAPHFVLLEVCFLFGIRAKWQQQVQVKVDKAIAEWKASQKKKE